MPLPDTATVFTPSQISIHPSSTDDTAKHHLIFFITGNPGLIGYYKTYLSTLHTLLSSPSNPKKIFHIYGQSLAGFTDSESDTRQTPYSLEEQITISLSTLESLRIPSGPLKDKPYSSVILIGHSLGTYMLLEIIERLGKPSPVNIRAGILLFATVTHLAKSPSGVKFSTLFRIPNFPSTVGTVAKALVWLAPGGALPWLVGTVTGMPSDGVAVTTEFLRSRMGVWQALHLAKDELEFISEDKWDREIWGIEHVDRDVKASVPKLVFFFGQDDHWVANHTRDALIAARGRDEGTPESSKPLMIIDQSGMPHSFCIHHSETVAEKTSVWIKELMGDP